MRWDRGGEREGGREAVKVFFAMLWGKGFLVMKKTEET
jgi:hypothetical protein